MKAAIVLLTAICAAQAGLASDETGQQQLLAMRVKMGRTLKSLPNYVCLQKTERLRASKAKAIPKTIDTLEIEVAHVGDKEMYSWPGRNMFADSQLQKALPNGLVGTGAYASQVIDILFGPKTQFRWVGKEVLEKRTTLRWDFTIPKDGSDWTVGNAKRSAQVGSEGSVWADAETLEVVRLAVHATQFPARFPLKAVTRNIDYANMRIGARNVLLPTVVEDLVEESGGPLNTNLSRFGHCREYTTTSTLTFDAPAAQPAMEQPQVAVTSPPNPQTPPVPEAPSNAPAPQAPAAPSAPPSEVQAAPSSATLPPGLQVMLGLDDHIRPENAHPGMQVNAHLLSDVRDKGTVLAPKGTAVHGVIRQYAKVNDGFLFSFTLTIEFHELALPGGTVPFNAWLKRIDTPVKGLWWLVPSDPGFVQAVQLSGNGSSGDDSHLEKMRKDYEPGLVMIFIRRQESFHLFPGTRMTWVTSNGAPGPASGR